MADAPERLTLQTDFIDPATEDWSSMDAGEVWHAAKAGIPQAVAELAKREAAFAADPASQTSQPKRGPNPAELRAALRRRTRR